MCLEMEWILQLSSSKYSHSCLGILTPRLLQHILYGAILKNDPECSSVGSHSGIREYSHNECILWTTLVFSRLPNTIKLLVTTIMTLLVLSQVICGIAISNCFCFFHKCWQNWHTLSHFCYLVEYAFSASSKRLVKIQIALIVLTFCEVLKNWLFLESLGQSTGWAYLVMVSVVIMKVVLALVALYS